MFLPRPKKSCRAILRAKKILPGHSGVLRAKWPRVSMYVYIGREGAVFQSEKNNPAGPFWGCCAQTKSCRAILACCARRNPVGPFLGAASGKNLLVHSGVLRAKLKHWLATLRTKSPPGRISARALEPCLALIGGRSHIISPSEHRSACARKCARALNATRRFRATPRIWCSYLPFPQCEWGSIV